MEKLDYIAHKIWDMYKRVNTLRGEHKKKESFLKNNDGFLITTSEKLASK